MPGKRDDKYDVSGNIEAQYVDDAQTVLVNKLDLVDLESIYTAEEEGLANTYELLLSEVRTDTKMSCEILKYIHECIFGRLYEWAGRWRTVQISKPGAIWPAAQYLDQSMADFERGVLSIYPAESLEGDDNFCEALGIIQGEFLAIHPFREGNARTIKLMTDLISVQSGRPLLVYDATDKGIKGYITAAKAALQKANYRPMIEVIRRALSAARQE
ncbi:Adenosine monophosphate-protein transferase VbhT [Symmachiella dynata]|uniref:protein adenylyltransferase n=1 Tax=Symmachiella dynata TaxID=2527995 RepID=A0A517ZT86_9PLAN|nr:Fic family protein [Symmachiella dynata]QDT49930.1 Adenosine monophosphate-protein transferase VbhT [Symmachiella dynata]QDU45645.1 Adenosine monophosphate-protein transferase VbhT [Symmachiella dynata]